MVDWPNRAKKVVLKKVNEDDELRTTMRLKGRREGAPAAQDSASGK